MAGVYISLQCLHQEQKPNLNPQIIFMKLAETDRLQDFENRNNTRDLTPT